MKPFDPLELAAALRMAASGEFVAAAQCLDWSEAVAAALDVIPHGQPILATATRGTDATPEALAGECQAELQRTAPPVAPESERGVVAGAGPMSAALATLVLRLALSLLQKRLGL